MKLKYLYGLISLAVLFPSCNQEEFTNNAIDYDTNNVIKLSSVQLDDFENNTLSRATYEGYATKFEYNDKLGLILIDQDGKQLANAPFTYYAAGWTNDNTTYYSSKIDKIIAYFPYNAQLSQNVVTLDAVKQTIEIATDQSSLDKFKQTDLLACEIEDPSPELNLQLKHVFSLMEFSATQQLEVEGETFNYNIAMSNVSFSIGETMYTPCNLNGGYVCMIKDNSSLQKDDFRYFYTIEGKSNVKTLTTDKTITSGTKYTFPCPAAGMGEPNTLSAGDFYCTSTSDKVVILPSIAATIPEGLTCKGIVFYTMNQATFESYASTNSLTANDYPGYNNNHGLIISLKDGGPLGSASSFEKFLLKSIEDWNNKESLNGYKITQAMQEAVKDGTITSFTALNNHEEPASSATTSWFAPSFKELSILIRGGDRTTATGEGRAYINQQLQEIGGTTLGEGNIPSITFESQESQTQQNIVWFVTGKDGKEFSYPFTNTTPGELFRPICAF
ncbi:fimbrillin family protein [Phocaeicola plebeius]|uniref:fimbrillin family protein n=1 Tax=Phocaeicola plebeius TaxID=310297 RepID=UPI0026E93E6E|nr:fimbrillin family protein [Phocaeicola plebeius]